MAQAMCGILEFRAMTVAWPRDCRTVSQAVEIGFAVAGVTGLESASIVRNFRTLRNSAPCTVCSVYGWCCVLCVHCVMCVLRSGCAVCGVWCCTLARHGVV